MFKTSAALISAVLAVTLLGGFDIADYSLSDLNVTPPPAPAAPGSQPPMPPGTVAHWRFAGPLGSVASDESSVLDATGRFKAFIFGGPVYRLLENRPGLEFSGRDDRLFVNDDPAFASTDGLTLEAIVRYDGTIPDTLDQSQILFRGDDRGGQDPWFLAVRTDGRLMFHVVGETGDYVQILSPARLPVGRLMQVAGTLDCGSREMRLYIDGEPVCVAVTNLRPMQSLDPNAKPGIGIGNVQSSTFNEAFNGLISEVRISSRALDPKEMLKARETPRRPRSETEPAERRPDSNRRLFMR